MSTVVSNALQLNTSEVADENITLSIPLNPDGSMTMTKGSTEIMNVNTSGAVILKKPLSVGAGSIATTTTIDCATSNRFSYSTTNGSQTFSFTNVPSGMFYDMVLDMTVTASTTYTAPTVVASANATFASNTTTAVVTKPAGTAVGDYALVVIAIGSSPARTFTPPAGWTELADANDISGPYVAYKILDGSEGSTLTFTANGNFTGRMALAVVRGATAIRSSARTDTTSSTDLFLPYPNSLVLLAASKNDTTATLTFASGTSIYAGGPIGLFSIASSNIGPTGVLTWTSAGNTSPGTMAIGFDSTVSSTGPTITWPGSVTWQDGVPPPTWGSFTQRISLSTYNGGTNWYGSYKLLG